MVVKLTEKEPQDLLETLCWNVSSMYPKAWWQEGSALLASPLVVLHLQLATIFGLTSLIDFFFRRLRFPRICSEIMAGFILGKSGLKHYGSNISDVLFPEGDRSLDILAFVGFMFFMFLYGIRMDLTAFTSKSGSKKKALWIGVLSMLISCVMLVPLIGFSTGDMGYRYMTYGLMIILTPYPVICLLLTHLRIVNTELGQLALSSSLVSNMLSTFVLWGTGFVRSFGYSNRIGIAFLVSNFVVFVIFLWVWRPGFQWIIKRTPEGRAVKEIYITFVMLAVLSSCVLCDVMGVWVMYGPLVLGLVIPAGPPLGSTLVERFDTIVSGFLLPIITTRVGFKTDVYQLKNDSSLDMTSMLKVMSLSLIVKIATIATQGLLYKMPGKDAASLALILSAKGIIDIGSVYLFTNVEIPPGEFALATISIFIIAAIIPVMVSLVHDSSWKFTGYERRNLQDTPINEELRVLVCAHWQNEALAAIKLLAISNPSPEEFPLTVYGLKLETLPSGSTPVLVNHQLGQKTSPSSALGQRSKMILDVFYYFREQSSCNVNVFTAISLPKLMPDDICMLALEKMASLIILPFHRSWTAKGKLITDSRTMRTVNINVLDRAPCSIGILVDRRKERSSSSILSKSSEEQYCVAVVFLGGEDDREAIAYAKRLARNSTVILTVVHITTRESFSNQSWSDILDQEALKDIRHGGFSNIMYREEIVEDASETATIIRAMEGSFELIMVGQGHETNASLISGLSEWSEFPELGPVGDILASSDIGSSVSALIVKKQIIQVNS